MQKESFDIEIFPGKYTYVTIEYIGFEKITTARSNNNEILETTSLGNVALTGLIRAESLERSRTSRRTDGGRNTTGQKEYTM